MTRLEALRALHAAVKDGGEWGGCSGVFGRRNTARARDAYHGSVDAALALIAATLPGWTWRRTAGNIYVTDPKRGSRSKKWSGPGLHPATALLLAIIAALIAEEEAKCRRKNWPSAGCA